MIISSWCLVGKKSLAYASGWDVFCCSLLVLGALFLVHAKAISREGRREKVGGRRLTVGGKKKVGGWRSSVRTKLAVVGLRSSVNSLQPTANRLQVCSSFVFLAFFCG